MPAAEMLAAPSGDHTLSVRTRFVDSTAGAGILYQRSSVALWRVVLNDVVVASAHNDRQPFTIRGGAALWRLLVEPCRLDDIIDFLGGPEIALQARHLIDGLVETEVVDVVVP